MFATWSEPTAEELLYIIKSPIGGTSTEMLLEYALKCALPAAAVLFVAIIVFAMLKGRSKLRFTVPIILIMMSLSLSGFAVGKTWIKMDLGTFFGGQLWPSRFVEKHYVDPNNVKLSFPEKKRNLIYIFLESIEVTFADERNGGAFFQNVIPELTRIADENEDFRGYDNKLNGARVLPGGTWTIGAMFSQTAGLPLKISINGNKMNTQESFFKGVTALGDILERQGYKQNLLIGSDATFGGRRLYYTDHGNFDIYDYVEAKEKGRIPKDYRVWWGFEDSRLFDFAKSRLMELSRSDEPFHLTLLTVDTHFEDGYVCKDCRNNFGSDQYANVIACSSRKVKALLDWIKRQPFYENTTIVLAGDHLTMDKTFCESVDKSYDRKTYTAFINSAVSPLRKDRIYYTTLDMFPTTLASLDVKIEGDRLGLGTNLFSVEKTLLERFGFKKLKRELSRRSEMLESLADIKVPESPQPLSSPEPYYDINEPTLPYITDNRILLLK